MKNMKLTKTIKNMWKCGHLWCGVFAGKTV